MIALDRIYMMARMCHEVMRAYAALLGDDTMREWDEAPVWQKDSTLDGVHHFIDHPRITPDVLHAKWMEGKIKDGWKYGEVKDAEKKEHPCLVPFDQLPFPERVKDYLFLAVCKAYARTS